MIPVQLCTPGVLAASSHPDSAEGLDVHDVVASICSGGCLTQSEGVALKAHVAYHKRFTMPATTAKLVNHPSTTTKLTPVHGTRAAPTSIRMSTEVTELPTSQA